MEDRNTKLKQNQSSNKTPEMLPSIVIWYNPKERAWPYTCKTGGTQQAGIFSHPHSFRQKSVKLIFSKYPPCGCGIHILTSYLFWTCFSWDSWVWRSHCIVSLLSQFEMCVFCNFFEGSPGIWGKLYVEKIGEGFREPRHELNQLSGISLRQAIVIVMH